MITVYYLRVQVTVKLEEIVFNGGHSDEGVKTQHVDDPLPLA